MWDDKNYIQELWTNGKNKIWDGLILEPKTLYYQPGGLLLYSSPLYPFQIGRGIDKIMNTIRYTVTHLVPFHLCYYNHLSLAPNFFYGKGDLHKKISHLPYLCKWSKWHVKKSSKWHIYWYLKFTYCCRCTRLNELKYLYLFEYKKET